MDDRLRLRESFGEDADRYDRARPGYPPGLFDALGEYAELAPDARILEIGCGTGQATVAIARRGWAVDAIELSPDLAAVARRKVAGLGVPVTVGSFDEAELPQAAFDAVVAFTSFHWLDPATRVTRAAAALRHGGVLATVGTIHVQGDDDFFARAQECYRRWDPDTPEGYRLPRPDELRRDAAEIDAGGMFAPAVFREFPVDVTYTAEQYVDLLLTYSPILAMPPPAREGLLRCLAEVIGDTRITKSYVFQHRMARRRACRARFRSRRPGGHPTVTE